VSNEFHTSHEIFVCITPDVDLHYTRALANVQAHIAIKPPPEAVATESQAMEIEEQDKGINEAVINKLSETSAVYDIICIC